MYQSLLFLCLLTATQTYASEVEPRDGSITLNGNNNNYWQSALIIIPILIIIVVLDFAIFGTFASRSDELNPVSAFFFHARNGLQSLRYKRRHGYNGPYQHRVQRSKPFVDLKWKPVF